MTEGRVAPHQTILPQLSQTPHVCPVHADKDRNLLRLTTAPGHRFNLRFHIALVVQSKSKSLIATNQIRDLDSKAANHFNNTLFNINFFEQNEYKKGITCSKIDQTKIYLARGRSHRSSRAERWLRTVGALLLRGRSRRPNSPVAGAPRCPKVPQGAPRCSKVRT